MMKANTLTPNVYVRFKPGTHDKVEFTSDSTITINALQRRSYTFDQVFKPESSNQQVFKSSCQSHIDTCLSVPNKSVLVFVYGNTGTGKTHTIGLLDNITQASDGLIPLGLKQIFSQREEVSLSFYQIYLEQVYDLLSKESKSLQIRQNQKEPYLENLLEVSVGSYCEAQQLINIGREQRRVAQQKLNRNSSRSHAILTISIFHQEGPSKLCFVDLAGSQRLKETEARGLNMTEAVHINSSLSSLQTVLVSLGNGTQPSYRNSKLTRLLQPYLSGRISLIVTSNGSNLQSIDLAKRCKGIKIVEQSEQKEALSRIRYLEEQLEKARRCLRKDSVSSPLKTKENKENKQSRRSNRPSDMSKSQRPVQQKFQVMYLLRVVTKLVAVLETTYKNLQRICTSVSHQQIAYDYIESLKIKEIDTRQFMQDRLSSLKPTSDLSLVSVNSREIMETLQNDLKFTNKIREISTGIVDLGVYLSNSRSYVQQLCTCQLKCHFMERKSKHNDQLVACLLTKIDKKTLKQVQSKLDQLGLKTENKRKSYIRIQEELH